MTIATRCGDLGLELASLWNYKKYICVLYKLLTLRDLLMQHNMDYSRIT